MTLTISQPYFEFTELGLNSMAAASSHSNFCAQQKHVSAQVPTLDEGNPPEGMGSSWAASTAWTLPIPPRLLSLGVGTHPAPRLLTHICLGLHDADIPQETPPHTGKGLRLPGKDGRGDLAWPGAPVLTFCSFRQRARGLS